MQDEIPWAPANNAGARSAAAHRADDPVFASQADERFRVGTARPSVAGRMLHADAALMHRRLRCDRDRLQ